MTESRCQIHMLMIRIGISGSLFATVNLIGFGKQKSCQRLLVFVSRWLKDWRMQSTCKRSIYVGVRLWIWFCAGLQNLSYALWIVLLTISVKHCSMTDKFNIISQVPKFLPRNNVWWIFCKYCKVKVFLFKKLRRSKQSYAETSHGKSSNNIVFSNFISL